MFALKFVTKIYKKKHTGRKTMIPKTGLDLKQREKERNKERKGERKREKKKKERKDKCHRNK